MYHGNKAQILQVYDPKPNIKCPVQSTAIIIDLSTVIRSRAVTTNANIFKDFLNGIINVITELSNGCSRIDAVTDSHL